MLFRTKQAALDENLQTAGFSYANDCVFPVEDASFYNHIANNAPVMIWVTEPDGLCSYVNRAWGELTGQTLTEALETGWTRAVHPDDRAKVQSIFSSASDQNEPFHMEYRLKSKSGNYHWVICRAAPYFSQNQAFLGYIGSVIDITERKQMEELLLQSQKQLALEIKTMNNLHDCSRRLLTAPDLATALYEVLYTSIQITDADFGAIQMVNADLSTLEIVASFGFDETYLDHFEHVPISKVMAHGGGNSKKRRRVVVYDVEQDLEFRPDIEVIRTAGYRSLQATPLVNKKGELLGFFSTYFRTPRLISQRDLRILDLYAQQAVDIIEHMRADKAVHQSEQRLRLATEKAGIGIWEIDLKKKTGLWSGSATWFMGQENFTVEEWLEKCHPDDRDNVKQLWETPDCDDGYKAIEFRLNKAADDGSTIWLLGRGNKEQHGDKNRCSGVIFDITDRKVTEQMLKEAHRRKDEFLATLAHELRNPLAPIGNAAHLMKSENIDEAMKSRLTDIIDRQVRHMIRIIDDLMDVSRITKGKIKLQLEHVKLSDSITNALESVKPLIEKAGHKVDVNLAPNALYIYADPARITQIFSNILNNASKYTPPGGHIAINVRSNGKYAIVSIKDNGPGIPPDMRDEIFEMFSQVKNTQHSSQGGLGIGLTLVKNLTALHNGYIELGSCDADQGSEFRIFLPLTTRKKKEEDLTSENERPVTTGVRTLVVDDNKEAAQTIGWMMEALGQEVRVVFNGQDAIKAADDFRPDLVLLDIGLPDICGYEICSRLRKNPSTENAVIVAQTGWGQKEHRQRSRQAGFDYHLIKPLDMNKLEKIIEQIANGKKGHVRQSQAA